jgi:hypothetical protein
VETPSLTEQSLGAAVGAAAEGGNAVGPDPTVANASTTTRAARRPKYVTDRSLRELRSSENLRERSGEGMPCAGSRCDDLQHEVLYEMGHFFFFGALRATVLVDVTVTDTAAASEIEAPSLTVNVNASVPTNPLFGI